MSPGIGNAAEERGPSLDVMKQPSEYELSMTSRMTVLCSTGAEVHSISGEGQLAGSSLEGLSVEMLKLEKDCCFLDK